MKFKVGTKEFEITDEEITKAINEKKSVMDLVSDVVVRSQEEETKFVENMKKDARKEGVEISVKKTREELGLTFEGKTVENLVKAVSEKAVADAKLNPDEKVTKLETKLQDKEKALATALQRAEETEKRLKNFSTEVKVDKLLETYIPKNTLLPVEDIKVILKSKLTVTENEDGGFEVKDMLGNVLKNATTQDPLPVKDAIENFFRDNTHYVKGTDGGTGGGDSGSGASGKMTVEKFNESMKASGIEINTPEYTTKLQEAMKAETIDLEA